MQVAEEVRRVRVARGPAPVRVPEARAARVDRVAVQLYVILVRRAHAPGVAICQTEDLPRVVDAALRRSEL